MSNPASSSDQIDNAHRLVTDTGAPASVAQSACNALAAEHLSLIKCAPDSSGSVPAHDSATTSAAGPTDGSTGAVQEQVKMRWPNLIPAQGSYYHKVTTAYGTFIGISTDVKLGEPKEDPHRTTGSKKKPLDGFSAYVGGNVFGKHEVDAGLSWSITRDAHGKVDYQHKAWRPFWRDASWGNAPAESRYYWNPGDVVTMTLTEVGRNKLKLSISDAGLHPKRSFSKVFDADGFDPQVLASFKRVDSIDQVGREGKSVLPTRASLLGINWLKTDVLTLDLAGHVQRTPLDAGHRKVIEPLPYHIFAQATAGEKSLGGEHVDIYGSRPMVKEAKN